MKNLTLTAKVSIIFVISFVITSSILAIVIVGRMDSIFENTIYDQLESQAKGYLAYENADDYLSGNYFYSICYSSKQNEYIATESLKDIISQSSIKLIVNKSSAQDQSIGRYKNLVDNKRIYYVVLNYSKLINPTSNDYIIVLTDDSLKRQMVLSTTLEILFACLLAYLLGYGIILAWISKMIKDTKGIALTLDNIGKNHYKTKIHTTRKDEIGSLVKSIELMRQKIVSNEKHKQEIIQGVSHDLKTPIAIIQSYAEALEDGIYEKDEAALIIQKQSNRLNNKVKKLLTLTRLGYFDMSNSSIGNTEIRPLLEDILSYYNNSKCEIKTNLQDIVLKGDYDSWQIVLENILDNAIRYAQKEIIITLTKDKLSIYNDGKSIDGSKLSSIFNAYEKGNDGNFGIGLSIVKRTLTQFGYNIYAVNQENGVTFFIDLQT